MHSFFELPAHLKGSIGRLEEHLLWGALESMAIGAGDGLKLGSLRCAIGVEHALLGATSRREITERLVLPVGPRREV